MRRYLLDTSAVRSASGKRLAEKAKTAELVASPFAFWEIASHLRDEGDFHRIKANLMKFRHVKLLHDPTASAERELELTQLAADEDLETPDVIYAVLAALRTSNSVEAFYKCQIQDSKGTVRSIDGCVSKFQEMLLGGENRFKAFIASVRELVLKRDVVLSSPTDFHDGTLDLTSGWWIQIRERSDHTEESYRKLIRRGYFFYSYVLHRAADYAVRHTANIDANDFEDAKMLLHITIDDDVTVLTSDNGLRKCVQSAITTLNGLNADWYKTNVQVCDTQSFLSII